MRKQNYGGKQPGLLLTARIMGTLPSQMITEGGVHGNPGLNHFQGKVLLEPFGQEQPSFCSRPCGAWKVTEPCLWLDLKKVMEADAPVMCILVFSRWE